MSENRYRLYNGKWDGIWDKPKYERIRKHILDSFNGIEFLEEPHKYFYKGKELIPTSHLIHAFKPEFNEEMMAAMCVKKYFDDESSKYYHMTRDEIIESWHAHSKKSTDHGTKIHLFGENTAYFMMKRYDLITKDYLGRINSDTDGRKYIESLEPKEEAILRFWDDLPVSIIPILFEVQMFDLDWGVSGTADLLFLHDPHIEWDDNDEEIKNRLYMMDYKGLDINTPILTVNGWKTMGTVEEGDYVYDRDGNLTKILHVSEVHHNPCYEITIEGHSYIADHEHRWVVKIGEKETVLTTEEISSVFGGVNMYIPTSDKYLYAKIDSIKKTKTVPTRCIEVDSPSHTYNFGHELLVTHNTNADLYKAYSKMLEPFSELPDSSLSVYKLQAATYTHFLMNLGYDFVARALIWLRDTGEYEKIKMESLTKPLEEYLTTHPVKQLLLEHK